MALVRLLGPIDVVGDDGDERNSGSALRRTILALLGLHAGEVLSPDWLMEHVALRTHQWRQRLRRRPAVGEHPVRNAVARSVARQASHAILG